MKNSNIGNLVASEMVSVMGSSAHTKIFGGQVIKTAAKEECKCSDSCKCKVAGQCMCAENCQGDCDICKKKATDIVSNLLALSEKFDNLGFEKIATKLIKAAQLSWLENEINKEKEEDFSPIINSQDSEFDLDFFNMPSSKEFIEENPELKAKIELKGYKQDPLTGDWALSPSLSGDTMPVSFDGSYEKRDTLPFTNTLPIEDEKELELLEELESNAYDKSLDNWLNKYAVPSDDEWRKILKEKIKETKTYPHDYTASGGVKTKYRSLSHDFPTLEHLQHADDTAHFTEMMLEFLNHPSEDPERMLEVLNSDSIKKYLNENPDVKVEVKALGFKEVSIGLNENPENMIWQLSTVSDSKDASRMLKFLNMPLFRKFLAENPGYKEQMDEEYRYSGFKQDPKTQKWTAIHREPLYGAEFSHPSIIKLKEKDRKMLEEKARAEFLKNIEKQRAALDLSPEESEELEGVEKDLLNELDLEANPDESEEVDMQLEELNKDLDKEFTEEDLGEFLKDTE